MQIGGGVARHAHPEGKDGGHGHGEDRTGGQEVIARIHHDRDRRHIVAVPKHVAHQPGDTVTDEESAAAARNQRDQRKQNIPHDSAEGGVAQCFQAGDLRAFLLHQPHHRREDNQQGDGNENEHQNIADAAHLVRAGQDGFEAVIVVQRDDLDVIAEKSGKGGLFLLRVRLVLVRKAVEKRSVLRRDIQVALDRHGQDGHRAVQVVIQKIQLADLPHVIGNFGSLRIVIARFAVFAEGQRAPDNPLYGHGDFVFHRQFQRRAQVDLHLFAD